MAHYKRCKDRKIKREQNRREFYHIVDTTSSIYGKKGNVNSMNPYRNVTTSAHGDESILTHYRKDMGCYHYNVNLKKQYERKLQKQQ